MNSLTKFFVFLLFLILSFNITFSFCAYSDIEGCYPTGSACITNFNCISKLCVNSVCQPNHSQVMDINRIWNRDALFERIELTAKGELKALLFYNETISTTVWEKVSLMKGSNNWVNNELYADNISSRYIFDTASGYFDDGTKVYFNVVGWDVCGATCRNNFEIFGGEGLSNTRVDIVPIPNGSLKTYSNGGLFTERYRLNQYNSSINLDCVSRVENGMLFKRSELLFGNPTTHQFPSIVHSYNDYVFECTQYPVFFDKLGSKVAITLLDKPADVTNPVCAFNYCEGSTATFPEFPYSCACLDTYGFHHTPFVKIDSYNRSVFFSFSGNNLRECTQVSTGMECRDYTLNGLGFNAENHFLQNVDLDIELIDNIPYIAGIVNSSQILLCNKDPIADSFNCRIVVDLNYLAESNDVGSKQGTLIDNLSIEPYNGKLALAYAVESSNNEFRENGFYLGYFDLPYFCQPSGEICSVDSECCNNDCFLGTCSPCGLDDDWCPANCNFENDGDCLCGNGDIDVGENCLTCEEDVVCGIGEYCDTTGVCQIREVVDSNCGNRIIDVGETCSSCPSDVKCDFGQTCVNNICSNVNSISKFNLFIDNNKLYAKINCLFSTSADFNIFIDSEKVGSLTYSCESIDKDVLLGNADEKGVVYSANMKIPEVCDVCLREQFLRIDLDEKINIPDNNVFLIIFILLSISFIFIRKEN